MKNQFFYGKNVSSFLDVSIRSEGYIHRINKCIFLEMYDWSNNPEQRIIPQHSTHVRTIEQFKKIKKGIFENPGDQYFYFNLKNYKWQERKKMEKSN